MTNVGVSTQPLEEPPILQNQLEAMRKEDTGMIVHIPPGHRLAATSSQTQELILRLPAKILVVKVYAARKGHGNGPGAEGGGGEGEG